MLSQIAIGLTVVQIVWSLLCLLHCHFPERPGEKRRIRWAKGFGVLGAEPWAVQREDHPPLFQTGQCEMRRVQ